MGTEFYRKFRNRQIYCIQDSGETVFEVLDVLDFGPYDDANDFQIWESGHFATTDTPGEFLVVIDSTGQTNWGVKYHVFHVTDYGENISRYEYYLRDFIPRPPTILTKKEINLFPPTNQFHIYPNPADSSFTIYTTGFIDPVQLSIYDVRGNILSSRGFCKNYSNTLFISSQDLLSGKSLPSGLYFLQIASKNLVENRRITLMK